MNSFIEISFEIVFFLKEEQKILQIEKVDSPPNQQRSRLDSNAQSNQTTSQNVIWLCKKIIS